jgi:hypothetical protein
MVAAERNCVLYTSDVEDMARLAAAAEKKSPVIIRC